MSKKILLFTVLLFFLFPTVYSKGFDNSSSFAVSKAQIQEKKDLICKHLEEQIDEKVSRFRKYKDVHVDKYYRVRNRLNTIVEKLEKEDFDVTKLKEDIGEFEEMINQYALDYAEFIEGLGFIKGVACGKSDGDFKVNLESLREKFGELKQTRVQIREFYK